MSKIQFTDKETLNTQPDIEDKNKITADDMNEIKYTVNQNDDRFIYNVGNLSDLATPSKTSVVDAINDVYYALTKVYQYELIATGETLKASGWREFSNTVTTETLPPGKYIVLYHFAISTSNDGIASVRPLIDGVEISNVDRQTVPLQGSLLSSSTLIAFTQFTTRTTHTLSSQCYPSIDVLNLYNTKVEFIKIG